MGLLHSLPIVDSLPTELPRDKRHGFNCWVWKIPWGRDRLPTPVFLGFPGGSGSEEFTCNVGDLGLIPGLKDPLEEGMATHSSILAWRITRDRGAWWATVRGVAKSQTRLSDFHSSCLLIGRWVLYH